MIDNIVILSLLVLSFMAGKKISDSYNDRIIRELQFQIRKNDIEKGIGYIPHHIEKRKDPIGQEFMDRMRKNGRATQAIRTFPCTPQTNK